MADEPEVVVPQPKATDVEPKPPEPEETVTIPKKDFEALSHKADVSSQNFERLQKEKEKREELEAELSLLRNNPVPSEMDADRVGRIESELATMRANEQRRDVLETYPQLKDLWSDLESFREEPDNKGMSLKTAAKAFLVEKGLLDGATPPRKGLEPPTGGDRTPIPQGMSVEEAENLRKTDFKKYRELLKSGKLKVNYNS